jgi:hypothetical protein
MAFKPDIVQIFPGKSIQIITPDAVSQHANTVHKEPQIRSLRPKSLVALKSLVASLLLLCAVKAPLRLGLILLYHLAYYTRPLPPMNSIMKSTIFFNIL